MSFPLKYPTECDICEEEMSAGTEVEFRQNELCHAPFCPVPKIVKPKPVCDRCYLELPANGICGECE